MFEQVSYPLFGQFVDEVVEDLPRCEDVDGLRFTGVPVGVGADDSGCGSPYMGVPASSSSMRH